MVTVRLHAVVITKFLNKYFFKHIERTDCKIFGRQCIDRVIFNMRLD